MASFGGVAICRLCCGIVRMCSHMPFVNAVASPRGVSSINSRLMAMGGSCLLKLGLLHGPMSGRTLRCVRIIIEI